MNEKAERAPRQGGSAQKIDAAFALWKKYMTTRTAYEIGSTKDYAAVEKNAKDLEGFLDTLSPRELSMFKKMQDTLSWFK